MKNNIEAHELKIEKWWVNKQKINNIKRITYLKSSQKEKKKKIKQNQKEIKR